MELLLKSKAKADIPDGSGDFPIHLACIKGHLEVLQTLVQNKALYEGLVTRDGHQPCN